MRLSWAHSIWGNRPHSHPLKDKGGYGIYPLTLHCHWQREDITLALWTCPVDALGESPQLLKDATGICWNGEYKVDMGKALTAPAAVFPCLWTFLSLHRSDHFIALIKNAKWFPNSYKKNKSKYSYVKLKIKN